MSEMRRATTPIRVILLLAVACAMGVPSRPHADGLRSSGDPSAEEIRAVVRRVVEATDVHVEHRYYRLDQVSLGSKPCRRREQVGNYFRPLHGDWAHRFATTLGIQRLGTDSIRLTCRGDSTRSDVIKVTFGKGKRAVTSTLDLVGGTALYAWDDSLFASMSIAREAGSLLQLIAEALPKNEWLGGIHPCTEATATPAPARTPRSGDMVYVEQLPEAIHRVPPVYPEAARRKNVAGTVLIQALVTAQGTVAETLILNSIPMLDEAAVRAVEQWRFEPARSEGKAVAVWVAVPVKFRLD